MKEESLQAEQQYLATLLEAIHRCVFFLNASVQKFPGRLHKNFWK